MFADTAEFVGHVSMPNGAWWCRPGTCRCRQPMQKLDVNSNGVLERSGSDISRRTTFTLIDANRDGVLSGAELARGPVNDVYLPTHDIRRSTYGEARGQER